MTNLPHSPTEKRTSSQVLFLRDYKYLDTERLSDYLATAMPEEFEQTVQNLEGIRGRGANTFANKAVGVGRIDWGKGDILDEENPYEQAVKIGAKQLFTQLHVMLRSHKSIELIHDNEPTGRWDLKIRDVVEITRDFKPALDDTIKRVSRGLQALESLGLLSGDEEQRLLSSVRRAENEIRALVAVPVGPKREIEDASVVFLAQAHLIIGGRVQEFEGNMAVCGKVQARAKEEYLDLLCYLLSIDKNEIRKVTEKLEEHLKLLDKMLKDLERTKVAERGWVARLFQGDPQEELDAERRDREARKRKAEEALEHLKVIDWDRHKIRGPVLVITPLAVYS